MAKKGKHREPNFRSSTPYGMEPIIDFGKVGRWVKRTLAKGKAKKRKAKPAPEVPEVGFRVGEDRVSNSGEPEEGLTESSEGMFRIGEERIRGPQLKKRSSVGKEERAKARAARKGTKEIDPGLPATERWFAALERFNEHLATHTGRHSTLRTRIAHKAMRGTPWALVARFAGFDDELNYGTLYAALSDVESDGSITRAIGRRRLSRMVVMYKGVESRQSERIVTREWTLAEIAPWEAMLARAMERLSPDIEDSIGNLYNGPTVAVATRVEAVYVWLSSEEAAEVSL